MKGTEKQVKWAKNLLKDMAEGFVEDFLTIMKNQYEDYEDEKEEIKQVSEILKVLLDDAKYIIDIRNDLECNSNDKHTEEMTLGRAIYKSNIKKDGIDVAGWMVDYMDIKYGDNEWY